MDYPKEIAGYRCLARIGEGAASEIYAVQHPKTKQVWALKRVQAETEKERRYIDQVESEYAVGSKLQHPSIRTVNKIIRQRNWFKVVGVSLVMELVDAQTLDKRLPRTSRHAVQDFIRIGEGLSHMHECGFVHADMKPSNVLIDESRQIKIIDLGQACKAGTVKKRIQGTPGYMAPEQAHRESITPATDIYNFGAMMYWVLVREVIPTALPPKDETNLYSGALDSAQVEPPVPPHEKDDSIHPMLSTLVLDCVHLEPGDRVASMDEVVARLQDIATVVEAE